MTVPVVILTGFLGAGKTTLLNRMIAARALDAGALGGGRLGLIVNELGEVGIDGALLPSELTRQVELPGGCICCVRTGDLERTIEDLLAVSPELTTIVIETTGVAEPLPIAWSLENLGESVRLAAVLTLVDVVNLGAQRVLSPAVDAQIAYADAIVLTKSDLATEAQLAAVGAVLAKLAPRAPIVSGSPDEVVRWLGDALADPDPPTRPSIAAPPRPHGIDSVWAPIDGVIDAEELCDALAELPAAYIRVKGLARTEAGWVVVHRVGLRVSSEPLVRPPPDGAGRIVALGPGVERAPLAACVERAVLSSS